MRVFLFLACVSKLVLGTGVWHAMPELPSWWSTSEQEVSEEHPVIVSFSLKQQNLDKLYEIATRVSDPRSSSYGQYLSTAELRELTAPKAEHIATVEGWLSVARVQFQRLDGGEIIEASLTAGDASKLLSTHFQHLQSEHGQHALRAHDYLLPEVVDAAVSAVYGLHGLALPPQEPRTSTPTKPANVTPAVLAKTYGISGVKASGSVLNRRAVASFQDQTMDPKDLELFWERYGSSVPVSSREVYKFVGENGTGKGMLEASLDIEYLMGVAPGVPTEFWYWSNMTDFCGDLRKWSSMILASEKPPLVHSVSYAWQGSLDMIQCKASAAKDVDVNLAKLAARGITIIVASGDGGSGYSHSCESKSFTKDTIVTGTKRLAMTGCPSAGGCCAGYNNMYTLFSSLGLHAPEAWTYLPPNSTSNGTCILWTNVTGTRPQSGVTSCVKPQPVLWPAWPASSPWVTAVGATRFVKQQPGQPEMASDQFGSGGGFSWMFDAFKDQTTAVKQYLATASLPPKGWFPPGGRATPDVSALGEGYRVIINGTDKAVAGTSASTPAFAAMVSLLNEARLSAGKPAMGHLNPFLYQNPGAFTDVTMGSNAISRFGQKLPSGFNCTKGWDPATGLGTPIFSELLSAAMSAAPDQELLV